MSEQMKTQLDDALQRLPSEIQDKTRTLVAELIDAKGFTDKHRLDFIALAGNMYRSSKKNWQELFSQLDQVVHKANFKPTKLAAIIGASESFQPIYLLRNYGALMKDTMRVISELDDKKFVASATDEKEAKRIGMDLGGVVSAFYLSAHKDSPFHLTAKEAVDLYIEFSKNENFELDRYLSGTFGKKFYLLCDAVIDNLVFEDPDTLWIPHHKGKSLDQSHLDALSIVSEKVKISYFTYMIFEYGNDQVVYEPIIKAAMECSKKDFEDISNALMTLANGYTFKEYFEFVYAVKTVGEEKAKELWKFGIRYFGRYSKETLEAIYANLNPQHDKEKPLLLVVFTRNDWNGAFYHSGRTLDQLTEKFRVLITEVDTEDEFYDKVKEVGQKYGKINTLVIGGHGQADSIRLGNLDDEKAKLDLTDKDELVQLRPYLKEKPTVVLVSCSTGKDRRGIAALISKQLNAARVFAPAIPANVTRFKIDAKGNIIRVVYDGRSNEFLNGVPVKLERNE